MRGGQGCSTKVLEHDMKSLPPLPDPLATPEWDYVVMLKHYEHTYSVRGMGDTVELSFKTEGDRGDDNWTFRLDSGVFYELCRMALAHQNDAS